jgi:hypothetical protein
MKLKDASFLFRIYSFLMSNNKVWSALTDMINIFMTMLHIWHASGICTMNNFVFDLDLL